MQNKTGMADHLGREAVDTNNEYLITIDALEKIYQIATRKYREQKSLNLL